MINLKAQLSYSITVTVPCCRKEIDLIEDDQDYDGCISNPLFNNRWHDVKEVTVHCSDCNEYFGLDSIEY